MLTFTASTPSGLRQPTLSNQFIPKRRNSSRHSQRVISNMPHALLRHIHPQSPTPPQNPAPPDLYADIDGVSVHHTLNPSISNSSLIRPLVICIHGFGFGFTSRPDSLRYYTPHFGSRIIQALANAYSPDRPYVLMAHSMGSLSAVRNVLEYPNRISAIILVSPALVPAPPLPHMLRLFARAGAGFLAWAAVGASILLGPALRLILRTVVTKKDFWRRGLAIAREGDVPESSVEGYYAATRSKAWDKGVLNFSRAALQDRVRALGTGEDFVSMLSKNGGPKVPVLVIHGDKDLVVPVGNSRRLVDMLKGAGKLVVMEGCGHIPQEERPEEFCKIVRNFLDEVGVESHDQHAAVAMMRRD